MPESSSATSASFLQNRELSWLAFDERVLWMAEDEDLPLLERVRFLSIASRNLDEFFQVRVSGLIDQRVAGVSTTSPDGLSTWQQLRAIGERSAGLSARMSELYVEQIRPLLSEAGFSILTPSDLGKSGRKDVERWFVENALPILTPLSVDPAHPFPYVSDLSLNLGVSVEDPESGSRRFARVKIPASLPRFVRLRGRRGFIPVEAAIALNVHRLFPGMEIHSCHAFRVTRDAEIDLDDEPEDLVQSVQEGLERRRRAARPVRLEIDERAPEEVVQVLQRELGLMDSDVFRCPEPLDLGGLVEIVDPDRRDLLSEPWPPFTPAPLSGARGVDVFAVAGRGDLLFHHPYDDFGTTVDEFIRASSRDPDVVAIKATLYRTSAQEGSIIASLIEAAQSGKQVVALVELQARFDEEANLGYARLLEQAGAHVVYGLVGLKTHAKMLLVVRREGRHLRRYVHIGTGNYNTVTGRLYEDIGLLTADHEVGEDVSEMFNLLTGFGRRERMRALIVAPTTMRVELLSLISSHTGPGFHIDLKMNSLVDAGMIAALIEAARGGTEIGLVVRGICCLKIPEVEEAFGPGAIRVRSILGRYLEHSRIFRFRGPDGSGTHLIGSADLMPRNLDRRVEVLLPVRDPTARARLDEIIDSALDSGTAAWELQPGGSWRPPIRGSSSHQRRMYDTALSRASEVPWTS